MNRIVKDKVNKVFALVVIVVVFFAVISIMLKYKDEGETNMPFNLADLMVVSSADAIAKNDNSENNKWNYDINQYNDIYLNVVKNNEYDKVNSYIKKITIENIKINNPTKGTIEVYMPSTSETRMFEYTENLKVANSLTFNGGSSTNLKTLSIANQGGNIAFRVVNRNVSEYVSNQDDEIAYDGSLLNKTNVNMEELKFSISFDIVIETEDCKFRGNKTLNLPCENIENDGVSKITDPNCTDIIFKREN